MKVVILAGGFGTRLAEYTESIPKPMVTVGGKPIIWHIMNHYSKFGYDEFVIACGYRADAIKTYFANYHSSSADFTVNLGDGKIDVISETPVKWKVTLVDTGVGTLTGARIKRLQSVIGDEPFMLTYGDGVCNVNIDELVQFHKEKGKAVTLTSVRPSARFGELSIENGVVSCFEEKPQLHSGWINGGFFVIEPEFFNYIQDDEDVMLEREPLSRAVDSKELAAFRHDGFWQCMDTKRDRDLLEELWNSGNAPW